MNAYQKKFNNHPVFADWGRFKSLFSAYKLPSETNKSSITTLNKINNNVTSVDEQLKILKINSIFIDKVKGFLDEMSKEINTSEKLLANLNQFSTELQTVDKSILNMLEQHVKTIATLSDKIFNKIEDEKKVEADEREKRMEHLEDQIKQLSSLTVGAGLTITFESRRKKEEENINKYSKQFHWAILGFGAAMIVLNLDFIVQILKLIPPDFILAFLGGLSPESVANTASNTPIILQDLLSRFSLIVPILWFVLFVSKRRNDAYRMEQEYAHKVALTSSYENFKEQAAEFDRDDKVLIGKLYRALIDTVAHNPASALDGKTGDKTPVHEIADKVSERINFPITKSE